ncbi:MAG: cob(I)yrinic acid a,c-diamide adenosyltransferase [Bacteroidetes bacterium]|nr:cob(I)yrinic acid a,c-diamide adenosyltransferase [Bacteroidota bacterium]
MKIYTKTGDKGQTSLIGGTRVPKHHIRIEAYGTVDELNSWIGVLRDSIAEEAVTALLIEIQDRLFTMGSLLAADPEKSKMKLPELEAADISRLEQAIDAMNEHLPPMRSFVLPGGHITVSHCHVARCVCRRAERNVTHLSETAGVSALITQYLNRLSDYLFVLSRKLTHDLGATETPWKPRM